MKPEIEVKFFADREVLEKKIVALGGRLRAGRRLMRRQGFFVPDALVKPNMDQEARVRDEGDKITMTLKENPIPRTVDNRKELEIIVNNFDAAVEILTRSGYKPSKYMENYRTSWALGSCLVDIDEWPVLGSYAEIEAPSVEELKKVAGQLVLEEKDLMVCSLFDLFTKKFDIEKARFNKISRLTFEISTLDALFKALG